MNYKKHNQEHQKWSRRQFLTTGGMASLGSLMLGTTPVSAFAPSKMLAALNSTDSDRVLVLVYLAGGNDSLNMIVPHSVDAGRAKYEEYRPNIKQVHGTHYNDNHLLSNFGDTNFALNGNMTPLMDIWHNDQMHIVQNVGYPMANFSHFTSGNFWFAGVDSKLDPNFKSGWMGRYLEQLYPAFLEARSSVPMALNIGGQGADSFLSSGSHSMELPISDLNSYYTNAIGGQIYDTNISQDCNYGTELAYIRGVANNSVLYAASTHAAYTSATNDVTYSGGNSNKLALQLKTAARLIKGKLGTKIYMVTLTGFDTHFSQVYGHSNVLDYLATAIADFHQDLAATGDDERVVSFVFSEFGRATKENGAPNGGTDHGSLADLMLFGNGVNGGFSGTSMDLFSDELDNSSRVTFENQAGATDYRSIYATLLQDWLCVDGLVVDYVLGENYSRIPNLIADPCESHRDENPDVLLGHRINPKAGNSMEIRYGIFNPGTLKMEMLNSSGQHLTTLLNEHHAPGTYTITLAPPEYYFAPGTYLYKMSFGGKEYLRKLELE